MRTRPKVFAVVLLVLATAGTSTAAALHREGTQDRRLRDRALAAVSLTALPPETSIGAPELSADFGITFPVTVQNDGPDGVVVQWASWPGGAKVAVEQSLEPTAAVVLLLPQPPVCPTRRVTRNVDHVNVLVLARGGHKTVRLDLPDATQATTALNSRCGLFPARQSVNAAVSPKVVHRGEVVLDVAVQISGPRSTQLLSVQAGTGIAATVTEHLPLTLTLDPAGSNNPDIPHTATVTLHLQDCASVKAHAADQQEDPNEKDLRRPPTYYQLQLVVQHPGDVPERVNLGFPAAAANALTAACGIPRHFDGAGG
jgi:hypothetical protein